MYLDEGVFDPELTFVCTYDGTIPPVHANLSTYFHLPEELRILKDMLQCERYHGNVSDILEGFHAFNIACKRDFHALSYDVRFDLITRVLPAMDYYNHVDNVPSAALACVQTYRTWRRDVLPTHFKCANALHRAVFSHRNRVRIVPDLKPLFSAHLIPTWNMFKMYLCLFATQTRKHREKDIVHRIDISSNTLNIHATVCKHLHTCINIINTFERYAKTHEIHYTGKKQRASQYWKAIAHDYGFDLTDILVKDMVRAAFKYMFTFDRLVCIRPVTVEQPDLITRSVTRECP